MSPEQQPNGWNKWQEHVLHELDRLNTGYESTVRAINTLDIPSREQLSDVCDMVQVHDRDIATLKERQSVLAVGQSAFSLLVAGIAGFIGAKN